MSETDQTIGYASTYTPTLVERLWRRLGFRYHLGEEPPDYETLPGWIRTESGFCFGIGDRLRILLTGRLKVLTTLYTDTPSPNVTKTRMDWQIYEPGRDFR